MKKLLALLFTGFILFGFEKIKADDSSVKSFDQSCREFKELMISGNKLMFLRTNISSQEPTWNAVVCLSCTKERESGLFRVTSIKNKSVEWHYSDKDYLPLDETLVSDDDLAKKKLGMQSILLRVRKTCRSTLEPINEGSHLELTGNEQCVRHEYLRQYLARKYALDETGYTDIESKKDLSPEEFIQSCHQVLQKSADKSIVKNAFATVYLAVKHFFGGGLGEFDPVVARDSKTLKRQIATEAKSKSK